MQSGSIWLTNWRSMRSMHGFRTAVHVRWSRERTSNSSSALEAMGNRQSDSGNLHVVQGGQSGCCLARFCWYQHKGCVSVLAPFILKCKFFFEVNDTLVTTWLITLKLISINFYPSDHNSPLHCSLAACAPRSEIKLAEELLSSQNAKILYVARGRRRQTHVCERYRDKS